jgi:hypothetical protein
MLAESEYSCTDAMQRTDMPTAQYLSGQEEAETIKGIMAELAMPTTTTTPAAG